MASVALQSRYEQYLKQSGGELVKSLLEAARTPKATAFLTRAACIQMKPAAVKEDFLVLKSKHCPCTCYILNLSH